MASALKEFLDINQNREERKDIAVSKIRPFGGVNRKHIFKINEAKVDELALNIKEFGILNDLLIRRDPDGIKEYECLSGHHRLAAAEKIGIEKVPCKILNINEDWEANQIMVSSNRQRESLLPSEKAFIYRYEYEALKHQGRNLDGNKAISLDRLVQKFEDEEQTKISRATVQRLIKISNLNNELLDMLDNNVLKLQEAYNIAFLREQEQKYLVSLLMDYRYKITNVISVALKDASSNSNDELSIDELREIIESNTYEEEEKKVSIKISKKTNKIFPKGLSKEAKEMVIEIFFDRYKNELLTIVEEIQ